MNTVHSVVVGRDVHEPAVGPGRPRWRIVETNGRGHRLWYVSLLLQMIDQIGHRDDVELITVPEVVDSASWREHITPWQQVLGSDVNPVEQSRLTILRRAARERAHLVIPDGDTWLVSMLAVRFRSRRSVHGAILLMRPQPNFELGSKLRHALKKALLVVLRVVHPHLAICTLAASSSPGVRDVVLDPVAFEPSGQKRDEWLVQHDLDPATKWLAVLGEVSERKCVGLVVDAMMTRAAASAGWGLVVIGKPSNPTLADRLKALSRAQPDRIVFRDTFISDMDFDTWVSVVDAVSVLYKNEGSSGVLLKCWAAGATVLLGGSASVLTAAAALDMESVAVTELSPEAILDAVLSVGTAAAAIVPDPSEWHGRSERFAQILLGLG